jgi:hypothetical protein
MDDMVVVLPVDHRRAGHGPVHIRTLADQTWVEDNDGSAALLRQHAARAGVTARIDLTAADLPGKVALVATGHAIALIPGVLTGALRADVTTVALIDPPTRGVYAITRVATRTRPQRPCSTSSRQPSAHGVPPTPRTSRLRRTSTPPRRHFTTASRKHPAENPCQQERIRHCSACPIHGVLTTGVLTLGPRPPSTMSLHRMPCHLGPVGRSL